jgi:putative hemolysin
MSTILTEVVVILMLLLANGVFAMTEIAVVSARRSRLRKLAEGGDARARTALALAESPNRFLATVQIGITLVGILAGAFGGATLAEEIGKALQSVPLLAQYGEGIGITCVVLGITVVSLVLGELVPKRIGLGNPDGIAMAGPMHRLSIVAGPAVTFLGAATDSLPRVLGVKPVQQTVATDDEVKVLMQEGLRAGAFHKVESKMVESVLELDRLQVRDIITPGPKMIWLNRDDSHETVWHKMVVSSHSFFPVYVDNRDHVAGIVSVKAMSSKYSTWTAIAWTRFWPGRCRRPPAIIPRNNRTGPIVPRRYFWKNAVSCLYCRSRARFGDLT